ncbi:imidazole glycerol phosphate synthase subunit HisH [bacterium]|nr:imidazole glycerol phosphate synthase subunit HisH [bacterium]
MGNLHSVAKALEQVGARVHVSSEPAHVARARGIVLPGVGAFGEAVRNLAATGCREVLIERIAAGAPFLGICLGLQLLVPTSEENPGQPGLAILPGRCRRFANGKKVPHIGWNEIEFAPGHPLLAGIPSGTHFYFVHSYYVETDRPEDTAARCDYGGECFTAVAARDRVFAVQFHPEKSQRMGLRLLSNFVRWVQAG